MKRIILEMPMKMPSDLGSNVFIVIDDISNLSFEVSMYDSESGQAFGELNARKIMSPKNGCPIGTYEIFYVEAVSGYGPLLYDIAIEWASSSGEGLMSDRESVSADARSVWSKYFNDRPDIIKIPLPETCNDPVAGTFRYGSPVPSTWSVHRYKKEKMSIISQLAALNKLKIIVDSKNLDLNNLRI